MEVNTYDREIINRAFGIKTRGFYHSFAIEDADGVYTTPFAIFYIKNYATYFLLIKASRTYPPCCYRGKGVHY